MKELVEKYEQGYELLVKALEGATEEEMAYKPAPDKWSIKEVVVHLSDTELNVNYRMKLMISETHPLFFSFNPDLWADNLNYQNQDHVQALYLFKALRLDAVNILRKLPDSAWERTGVHNESGKITLQQLIQKFAEHVDTHIRQIERNKQSFKQNR